MVIIMDEGCYHYNNDHHNNYNANNNTNCNNKNNTPLPLPLTLSLTSVLATQHQVASLHLSGLYAQNTVYGIIPHFYAGENYRSTS